MTIEGLITLYKQWLEIVSVEVAQLEERRGDDFDPQDWSGGNFDDAYEMGIKDGEIYKEYEMIAEIIRKLEAIK